MPHVYHSWPPGTRNARTARGCTRCGMRVYSRTIDGERVTHYQHVRGVRTPCGPDGLPPCDPVGPARAAVEVLRAAGVSAALLGDIERALRHA